MLGKFHPTEGVLCSNGRQGIKPRYSEGECEESPLMGRNKYVKAQGEEKNNIHCAHIVERDCLYLVL